MRFANKRAVQILLSGCLLSSALVGCTKEDNVKEQMLDIYGHPRSDWSWTTAPWTLDDAPYVRIRKEIVDLGRAGQIDENHLISAEKSFRQDEKNSQALFRWAFSTYMLSMVNTDQKHSVSETHIARVLPAFWRRDAISPVRSYNYIRLRFILHARDMEERQLRVLGERLLHHKPDDYYVKLEVMRLLDPHQDRDAKLQQRYAREMATIAPRDPRPRAILIESAYRRWSLQHAKKPPVKYRREVINEIVLIRNQSPSLPQLNKYADATIDRIRNWNS